MTKTTIQQGDVGFSIKENIIEIRFKGLEKYAVVDYSEEFLDILLNARFRIPSTEAAKKAYKFPYSNAYKKTLHQMVFDFYFGEEKRKNLYKNKYTIKHQDGDGFNCRVLNLHFSKGTLPVQSNKSVR